jgi:hypothetical protein
MRRDQDVNVRSMMLQLGAQPALIDMSIPMVWKLVGSTDPDSNAVIEIVKTIQKGLRSLGYPVAESGVVDAPTGRALAKISGPAWKHKTWLQLMGDVLNAKLNPQQKALDMNLSHVARQAPSVRARNAAVRAGLGSYFEFEGPPPGPLPGYMVGLPPGPLGLGDTAMDSGTRLSFGKGIKNPNNMVPTDTITRKAFMDLQHQINRLLSKVGERIGEDGVIGQGTLDGARSARKQLEGIASFVTAPIATASTAGLASKAVTVAGIFRTRADQLGISPDAIAGSQGSPPVKKSSPAVSDSTKEPLSKTGVAAAVAGGAVKEVLPWVLLAGAVAGGAVWWNRRQKKGRR